MLKTPLLIATSAMLTMTSLSSRAQGSACTGILDNAGRLACFDREFPKSSDAAAYKSVDLLDFKSAKQSLLGQRIEISGYAHFAASVLILSETPRSTLSVYVDPSMLPTVEQKRLLRACQDVLNGCPLTVRGTATAATFGEVAADSVAFKKR